MSKLNVMTKSHSKQIWKEQEEALRKARLLLRKYGPVWYTEDLDTLLTRSLGTICALRGADHNPGLGPSKANRKAA